MQDSTSAGQRQNADQMPLFISYREFKKTTSVLRHKMFGDHQNFANLSSDRCECVQN